MLHSYFRDKKKKKIPQILLHNDRVLSFCQQNTFFLLGILEQSAKFFAYFCKTKVYFFFFLFFLISQCWRHSTLVLEAVCRLKCII